MSCTYACPLVGRSVKIARSALLVALRPLLNRTVEYRIGASIPFSVIIRIYLLLTCLLNIFSTIIHIFLDWNKCVLCRS